MHLNGGSSAVSGGGSGGGDGVVVVLQPAGIGRGGNRVRECDTCSHTKQSPRPCPASCTLAALLGGREKPPERGVETRGETCLLCNDFSLSQSLAFCVLAHNHNSLSIHIKSGKILSWWIKSIFFSSWWKAVSQYPRQPAVLPCWCRKFVPRLVMKVVFILQCRRKS